MRCVAFCAVAACGLALTLGPAEAVAQWRELPPGINQGRVHAPFFSPQPRHRPPNVPVQRWYYRHGFPYYGSFGYPGYTYAPWGYDPYYYDYYYYPAPLNPPVYSQYGPQGLQNFLGPANSPEALLDRAQRVERGDGFGVLAGEAPLPERRALKPSNDQARALSRTFLEAGDKHFAAEEYREAIARYKKAVNAALDLPEPYFHQAFAHVAIGRYDDAARLLKRGLELEPLWPQSNFSLDKLYRGNRLAKETHLEALALAAEEAPGNPDLLFLVGVYLYFDGDADRSHTFFERAAQMTADRAHIEVFLRALTPVDDAAGEQPAQEAAGR